ncbi:hypothetical protein [Streptomyces alboflavus]|uniref:hypothetical protein n=1 Tax=Streptomyces alboflavus TaxID=67267 RepID=UPI0004BF9340|nr:hypothetical protein [Streptomyces alboflavus]
MPEPTPSHATAPPKTDSPAPGMTLRVYIVSRDGTITQDTGTRRVTPNSSPPPASSRPPLCVCSRWAGQLTTP